MEGFVILNSGDTLEGRVLHQPNSILAKECTFEFEGQVSEYAPMNIRCFGINESNRLFRSYVFNEEHFKDTLFLEYLVSGVVNLYYAQLEKEWFFIEKEAHIIPLVEEEKRTVYKNEVPHTKITKPYIGAVSSAFPGFLQKSDLESLTYGYKSFSKVTTNFHEATCDWDCIQYRKNTQNEIEIIPVMTPIHSQLRIEDEFNEQDYAVAFGVLFRFKSVRSEFISLLTGVELVSQQSFYDKEDIIVRQKSICIPLLVRWELVESKKLSVFLQGGLKNTIVRNSEYVSEHYNMYPSPNEDYSVHQKYLIGFSLGPGLSYKIKPNLAMILNPYYERVAPTYASGDYFDYVRFNNLGLTVGLATSL